MQHHRFGRKIGVHNCDLEKHDDYRQQCERDGGVAVGHHGCGGAVAILGRSLAGVDDVNAPAEVAVSETLCIGNRLV